MTSLIDINPNYLEIVRDILHKNLPSGVTVWVFGSRANWTTKDSSDLDLALEGDYILDHNTIVALEMDFEESNLPYKVDIIDINQVSNSFRHIVEAHKILLTNTNKPRSLDDQWSSLKFGDCAALIRDTILPTVLSNTPYIGLEHIGECTLSLIGCGNASDVSSIKGRFRRGDILFGKLRPYFRKIIRADFDGICSTDIWVVRPTAKIDADFLFYTMASKEFIDFATRGSEGTKMPRAKWEWVSRYDVPIPQLSDQRAISNILRALDDKIKLNRRMNQTLEKMARALFKSWFVDFDPVRAKIEGKWRFGESLLGLPHNLYGVFPDKLVDSELGLIPEGWKVRALDEIANFQNGLALQKYRPRGDANRLPVVKIAQLRSGKANSGEWASDTITSNCIIDDGDVIFSWSGSLMVKIWCGGLAALNQHLFRVTSAEYPKWFFLHWLLLHLPAFQSIAADKATTMGHINRKHLSAAKCIVPFSDNLMLADKIFLPILLTQINNEVQSRTLMAQRDALLPKLISGEMRLGSRELQAGAIT